MLPCGEEDGESVCKGNEMSEPTREVPAGRYRHYKGNLYEVLGVARHSETEEELVVYRALYGAGGLWVRPRAMFQGEVLVEGQAVPRFSLLGPAGEGKAL
jgi:hypothetical protein